MSDADQQAVRREIVTLAQSMIAGETDVHEGSRLMCRLRCELDTACPLFDVFVGFDSEMDLYPTGHEREHWNPDVLEKLDKQAAPYISRMQPILLESCRQLIKKYGVA